MRKGPQLKIVATIFYVECYEGRETGGQTVD